MARLPMERVTFDKVDQSKPLDEWKPTLADVGRRRHLIYSLDFDTRAHVFDEPSEEWVEDARRLHLENRERVKIGLEREFGSDEINRKIADFAALGTKPISILAYHNPFFHQARNAFVIGAYYPALASACALGERILNHLILDLRSFYKNTTEYGAVSHQRSFSNWKQPIDVLEAWKVLLPKAVDEFRALMKLRHRSIHFNASTYSTLRDDALAAIHHMREIIEQQFTTYGIRPWIIDGTSGQFFIKRSWESNPFIKTYYLPTCPFLGPYFAISLNQGLRFHDLPDYGDGDWTDEEFAKVYEARTPDDIVKKP